MLKAPAVPTVLLDARNMYESRIGRFQAVSTDTSLLLLVACLPTARQSSTSLQLASMHAMAVVLPALL